jgi:hypothetical protein
MSIYYSNDQDNPVKNLFDHKFKSELPKLINLDNGGTWSVSSIYDSDIISISTHGRITCEYAKVIIDNDNNIVSRELIITYKLNNMLYQTTFYLKIIPRPLLILLETNGQVINKEYDGTSIFNLRNESYIDKINYVSEGSNYKIKDTNSIYIEAKFHNGNKEVIFGGDANNLLDISLNIINKTDNYIIDIYSFGANRLNCCKEVGLISERIIDFIPNDYFKIYDGTNIAYVTFKTINVIDGDNIDVDYKIAFFENKNVCNNLKIKVHGIFIKPSKNSEKYKLSKTEIEFYGSIQAKPLEIQFEIESRNYNSSQYANISSYKINGIINNEKVQISKKYIALFEDCKVGLNKTVFISNVNLIGNDCKNYSVLPTYKTVGTITRNFYEVNLFSIDKEYDGTPNALIRCIDTDIEYDKASYDKSCVGTHIIKVENFKLTDMNLSNYLSESNYLLLGSILKKKLDIDFTICDKIYDGTINASINYNITNLILGDDIKVIWDSIYYKYPYVGNNYIIVNNIRLEGNNSTNYYYDNTIKLKNDIIKKEVKIVVKLKKTNYGSSNLSIKKIDIIGIIHSDIDQVFINKDELIIKQINHKIARINNIILYGDKSKNYFIEETINIDIPIKKIKLDVLFKLKDKVYNGNNIGYIETYKIEGTINDDKIYLDTKELIIEFCSIYPSEEVEVKIKNIKLLGDNVNYYEVDLELTSYGKILKKELDIDFFIYDKLYDFTHKAIIKYYEINGIVNNDNVDINDSYYAIFVSNSASLEKIQVKIFNVTLCGSGSNNYFIKNIFDSYALINQIKILPIFTVKSKIYDGTTSGEIEIVKFDNVINDDEIILNNDFTVNFSSTMASTKLIEVIIKNLSLSGLNSCNYFIDKEVICYSNIYPKPLEFSFNKISKIYDGTIDVNVDLTLSGVILGEKIKFKYTSINFDDNNIGFNKNIIIKGIQIIDNLNYTIDETKNIVGDIIKKELIINFSIISKNYDGNNLANIKIESIEGIIGNDKVELSKFNAVYEDINSSNDLININITKLEITNSLKYNYFINEPLTCKGYIFPKEISILFKIKTKEYDKTNICSLKSYTINGIYENEDIKLSDNIICEYCDINASDNFIDVKVTNIYLIGNNIQNYYIKPECLTKGLIIKKKLKPIIKGNNKVYDGTNNAKVNIILFDYDNNCNINCDYEHAYFNSINCGENILINVEGMKITSLDYINNYTINSDGICYGNIDKTNLEVIFEKFTKKYDGTLKAILTSYKLEGLVNDDDIKLDKTDIIANYESINVSESINIKIINLKLVGKNSDSYHIDSVIYSIGTIEPYEILCDFKIKDKEFDGTNNAEIKRYEIKKINDDDIDINIDEIKCYYTKVNSSTENIKVKIENITLNGTNSINYIINPIQYAYGRITQKNLNYRVFVKDKNYDGTNIASVIFNTSEDEDLLGKINFKYSKAYFIDSNVGLNKKVIIEDIELEGTNNYNIDNYYELYASILPIKVNVIFENYFKEYDGKHTANLIVKKIEGILKNDKIKTNDNFIATFDNYYFSNLPIKITISNLHLIGSNSKNYILDNYITNGIINKKKLIVKFNIADKEYDGTNKAVINSYTIEGIINKDNVDINKDLILYFEEYNSSKNKQTVILKNIYLIGEDSINYFTDNQVVSNAIIYPKKLIPQIVCKNKYYDGNDLAEINLKLEDINNFDKVICYYDSAKFENKDACINKKVFVSGIRIDNNKNYFVDNSAECTSNILRRTITPKITIYPKEYNNDVDVLFNIEPFINNDNIRYICEDLEIKYITKNVSNEGIPIKIYNIKLNDDTNYSINSNINISGYINKKKIIPKFKIKPKEYDGNKKVIIETYNLIGVYSNDYVELDNNYTCEYISSNYSKKKILVKFSNLKLKGKDAQNYYINEFHEEFGFIKEKEITINFIAKDKLYDGNKNINVEYTIEGLIENDKYMINFDSEFEDHNVGFNKKVTISKITINNNNYIYDKKKIIYASINSIILLPRFNIISKKYDGSNDINVIPIKLESINNDDVFIKNNFKSEILNMNFIDKNVQVLISNLELDGNNSNNYQIEKEIKIIGKLDPRELEIEFYFKDKVFDNNDIAFIDSYKIIGVINNDDVNINNNVVCKYESVNASDNYINIIVTKISLVGSDSINYFIQPIKKFKGYIHKKKIIPNFIVTSKNYDGKNNAIVDVFFDNILNEKINFLYTNSEYLDKNAGIDKKIIINNLRITNNNYELDNNYNLLGNINKIKLDIEFKIDKKIYNGNNIANVKFIKFIGIINNDDILLKNNYKATFEIINIGKNIKVEITNLELSGKEAHNYYLESTKVYFSEIIPISLDIEFNVKCKEYDIVNIAEINKYKFLNAVESDDIYLEDGIHGIYKSINASNNIEIEIKNIKLVGKDNKNYILLNSYKAHGEIIKKKIIPKLKLYDKVYDSTTSIKFDVLNSDEILFKNILFSNKNVGYNEIIINGLCVKNIKNHELNYQLKYYANIFKKEIIPSFTIIPKYYDGTNSVIIDKISINGKIEKDDVNLDTYNIYYEEINSSEKINIIVENIKLKGYDSENYFIKERFSLISSILPIELDIEFIIEDKEYDGTNIGKINSYNIKNTKDKLLLNDDILVTFSDINYSKEKISVIINNIELQEENKNYFLKKKYTSFSYIKKRKLECNYVCIDKNYDGTKVAHVQIDLIEKNINNYNITYDYAEYDDKNVGIDKNINIYNINIDLNNYYIDNNAKIKGSIKKKYIDLTFLPIKKIYDGNIDIMIRIEKLLGVIDNDKININNNFKSSFNDKDYSNDKKEIIIENINLIGDDKNNYDISNNLITFGFIDKKKLQISFVIKDKIYDRNNIAYIDSYICENKINTDNVFIDDSIISYFENYRVSNNSQVIIENIKLLGKDSSNYYTNDKIITYGRIIKKNLQLNVQINDKIYDGKNIGEIKNYSIDGKYEIDDIDLSKNNLSIQFSNSNVSKNIKVYINNISIYGSDINNYDISNSLISYGNIIHKNLDLEILFDDKEYDGNNFAKLISYNILNKINEDNVDIRNNFICSYIDINPSISDINYIEVKNVKLKGTSYKNYTINNKFIIKSLIKKRKIDVNFYFKEKIYDGTCNINIESYNLVNIIDSDIIELDLENINLYLQDINAGENKIIVKNINIIGKDSHKYYIDIEKTIDIIIKKRNVTPIFNQSKKIFDGTIDVNIDHNLLNICEIDLDDVNILKECVLDDYNYGTRKIMIKNVILFGKKSYNYFIESYFEIDGFIDKRELKINITKSSKVYDGKNNIYIEGYLENFVNDDNCNFIYDTAYFETESAGKNKVIFIKNIKLDKELNNYFIKTELEVIGEILKKKLEINFLSEDKIYDGNNIAIVNYKFITEDINRYNEDINITFDIPEYEDINVNKNIPIIINNIKLINNQNYFIEYSNIKINGNILKKELIIKGCDKEYDGTTKAEIVIEGIINNDIINYNANFIKDKVDKDIEIIYELLGEYKNNYNYNTKVYASINKKSISAIGLDKIYDSTNYANVSISGLLNDDEVFCNAIFVNKYVGSNIIIHGSLYGKDSENYILVDIKPSSITKKNINASAESKIYDGTHNIKIITTDLYENDDVNIVGIINDINVNINSTPVICKLEGNDSNNYNLLKIENIILIPLEIYGISENKIYDGNNKAIVTLSGILDIDKDLVLINAFFTDHNAGNDIKIDFILSGPKSKNYKINSINSSNILPKYISGIGVDKVYDNNFNCEIYLEGLLECDLKSIIPPKGLLITNNIGRNDVNIINIIEGQCKNNYILKNNKTNVNIIPKLVNINWIPNNKIFDNSINCIVKPNIIFELEKEKDLFIESYDAKYENVTVGINKKINIKNIKLSGPYFENFYAENKIVYSSIFRNSNNIYISRGFEIINSNIKPIKIPNFDLYLDNNFDFDYIIKIKLDNKISLNLKDNIFDIETNLNDQKYFIEKGNSINNFDTFSKKNLLLSEIIFEVLAHKLFGNAQANIAFSNTTEFSLIDKLIWKGFINILQEKSEIQNIHNQYLILGKSNSEINFTDIGFCLPIILQGQLSKNLKKINMYNSGFNTGGSSIVNGSYKIPLLLRYEF